MRNDGKLLVVLVMIVLVGVFGMLARSQPTIDEPTSPQAKAQPIDFSQGALPAGSLLASN